MSARGVRRYQISQPVEAVDHEFRPTFILHHSNYWIKENRDEEPDRSFAGHNRNPPADRS